MTTLTWDLWGLRLARILLHEFQDVIFLFLLTFDHFRKALLNMFDTEKVGGEKEIS
jgi:hypothetical protein